MVAADTIDRMVRQIVQEFHPDRVILSGSHARGTAERDSGVDLLVLLPHVEDKRQAAIQFRRRLAQYAVLKDIVVASPQEATTRGRLVGSVLRPAPGEGKVLYRRA